MRLLRKVFKFKCNGESFLEVLLGTPQKSQLKDNISDSQKSSMLRSVAGQPSKIRIASPLLRLLFPGMTSYYDGPSPDETDPRIH